MAEKEHSLSSNTLKMIAFISMALDHAGLMLFPAARWLRMAGRIAMPIFAYMIAEGMTHTRSMRRYASRVLAEGVLCQAVYVAAQGDWLLNIFLTFSLSFLMVAALRAARMRRSAFSYSLAALSIAACWFICEVLPNLLPKLEFSVDYGFFGALLPVLVWAAEGREQKLCAVALGILLVAVQYGGIQWYSFLALPLLALYKGSRGSAPLKWFFYIAYPLHFVLLTLLQWLI